MLDPAVAGDPALFAQVILGHETWSIQRQILRAIPKYSRIAVKACHSSSKTRLASEAVLWWLATRPQAICVTTAPIFDQVRLLLWQREIRPSADILRQLLGKQNVEILKTELRLANGSYAVGLSTNEGVRFQGFHSSDLLIIVDEAPGVKAEIYEAIEGARAGGRVVELLLGNPSFIGGEFYEAFNKQHLLWKTFSINAYLTPNLQGTSQQELEALKPGLSEDDPYFQYRPMPFLVTRRWIYEVIQKYGIASPYYQARVLAQFPDQSEDSLVALSWIEKANIRNSETPLTEVELHGPLSAGIDVAGEGQNRTVVVIRQGNRVIDKFKAPQGKDPRGDVAKFLFNYKTRLTQVNIDAIGEGDYFARHFEDMNYPVQRIKVGVPSHDPDRYKNLRAELSWSLRERFQHDEILGNFDEDTIAQLTAIKWKTNERGQIQIESKEDMKERGIESPDDADALMLAFAQPLTGVENFLSWMQRQIEDNKAKEAANSSLDSSVKLSTIEEQPKKPIDDNPLMAIYKQAYGGDSDSCSYCHKPVDERGIGIGASMYHSTCYAKLNSGISSTH